MSQMESKITLVLQICKVTQEEKAQEQQLTILLDSDVRGKNKYTDDG